MPACLSVCVCVFVCVVCVVCVFVCARCVGEGQEERSRRMLPVVFIAYTQSEETNMMSPEMISVFVRCAPNEKKERDTRRKNRLVDSADDLFCSDGLYGRGRRGDVKQIVLRGFGVVRRLQ